jgi:hypothetical protein
MFAADPDNTGGTVGSPSSLSFICFQDLAMSLDRALELVDKIRRLVPCRLGRYRPKSVIGRRLSHSRKQTFAVLLHRQVCALYLPLGRGGSFLESGHNAGEVLSTAMRQIAALPAEAQRGCSGPTAELDIVTGTCRLPRLGPAAPMLMARTAWSLGVPGWWPAGLGRRLLAVACDALGNWPRLVVLVVP